MQPAQEKLVMNTSSYWRKSSEKNITQHSNNRLAFEINQENFQMKVKLSNHLECQEYFSEFFPAPEKYYDISPSQMIKNLTGSYNIELLIIPETNFYTTQKTGYDDIKLKFIQPIDCKKMQDQSYIIQTVLAKVYHEIAHIELILNWPGGWDYSDKNIAEKRYLMLAQEILAGQAENCSWLTAAAIGGAIINTDGISVNDYTVQTISKIAAGHIDLSTGGREIAKLRLVSVLGKKFDPNETTSKTALDDFCNNTLSTQSIIHLLKEMQEYKNLLGDT